MRRTYIEKKGTTKKRPLGLPTWSDKLLQEVIRLLLEAYYEPQFSDHSHGFRPGRGCHTALQEIYHQWHGTVWFIEGDISDCFDRLDHSIMMIDPGREDPRRPVPAADRWTAPGWISGGLALPRDAERCAARRRGLSPILSQYLPGPVGQLHRDRPCSRPTTGETTHTISAVHAAVAARLASGNSRGPGGGRQLRKQMKTMPSRDPHDPGYRRLRYCRYADDWLLGFAGPDGRSRGDQGSNRRGSCVRSSSWSCPPTKTLITHGRTQAARFLGYEIVVLHADHKHDHRGHRSINAAIGLKVPVDVIRAKCAPYLHHGEPIRRTERTVDTDFSIVAQFQAEFRGVAEYYKLAFNRHRLGRLKYVMERSLTKTLARKYRISVAQVYRRYRAVLDTEHGPRRGLQVTVDRGGGKHRW